MKKIFTKEVVIGLCVAAAIVILIIGIEFLKGINVFKPANFYIARYENVAGLEVAAPVLIDGYKVGQVREITFNYEKPGLVEVHLALNKRLHVPEDSRAVIGSTLLSGSYIEIKLGKSEEMLPIGSDIPTGISPDMMATLTEEILPSVSAIVPKVDSLLLSVNRLVSDPALVASIKNVETITNNLSATSGALNIMMKRDLPAILGNANNAASNLDSISVNLNLLSAELTKLPLQETMGNVNILTENLSKFSAQLNNKNSTLGMLTQDPELYNRINQVAADVDSLIVDIKKNPKRYISIKLL